MVHCGLDFDSSKSATGASMTLSRLVEEMGRELCIKSDATTLKCIYIECIAVRPGGRRSYQRGSLEGVMDPSMFCTCQASELTL